MDYDISKDSVTCYNCRRQNKRSNLFAEWSIKDVFLKSGCKNWKKAKEKHDKHQASDCHKAAMIYQIILPTCGDTAEMLNENERKNREQNRHRLMIVFEAIRLLARQGLPIRVKKKDESNVIQVLKFNANLCPELES